jgi:hypothetical protein
VRVAALVDFRTEDRIVNSASVRAAAPGSICGVLCTETPAANTRTRSLYSVDSTERAEGPTIGHIGEKVRE